MTDARGDGKPTEGDAERQGDTRFADGDAVLEVMPSGRRRLAAGTRFSCALDRTGQPVCWGGAQVNKPPKRTLVSLSAGVRSVCGVDAGGAVACWSPNAFSDAVTTSIPPGLFVDVAVGGAEAEFACAVRPDGKIACWQNVAGADGVLTTPPSDVAFSRISLGAHHGCGVTSNGAVRCWGALNDALKMVPSGAFIETASGQESVCALAVPPKVRCWGMAAALEPQFPKVAVPVQLALHPGNDTVCLLVKDGRVGCYGNNSQLADVVMAERFVEIALGADHLCGVHQDGSVACFKSGGPATDLTPPADFRVLTR